MWGELKADTRNFESALKRADKDIRDTEKNLSRLEDRTKKWGNTSSTTARQQTRINEQLRAQKVHLSNAVSAFDQGIISHRKMAAALIQTDNKLAGYNSRIKDQTARLQDWSVRQSGLIGSFVGFGGVLSAVGLSVGAMAYGVGRAAVTVDDWRNVLRAATGSTEAANLKLAELNKVASESPGVLRSFAVATYALLRPMQISEGTINTLIQAFGRIKMSNPSTDLAKMAFNLNQLSVAFDLRDMKEAIENFPRFGEILKKAFNLKAASDDVKGLTDELKKLKAEGKLSKEDFMKGFAVGVESDVSLGKLKDTLGTKFEKLTEELSVLVAPMGHLVIDTFLGAIQEAKGLDKIFTRQNLGAIITGSIRGQLTGATLALAPEVTKQGQTLGDQLAAGLAQGIVGGQSGVISAAIQIAWAGINAAKNILGIHSPSKVFFAIGKDTAQGFIDGMESMRTGVHAKMAGLLDISGVKLAKGDAPGVELLTELIRELDELTPRTRAQAVAAELTAEKYKKLNAEVRERITLVSRQITFEEQLKKLTEIGKQIAEDQASGIDKLDKAYKELFVTLSPAEEALEKINELFADPDVITAMGQYSERLRGITESIMRIGALQKILMAEGSGRLFSEGPGLGGTDEEQKERDRKLEEQVDAMDRLSGVPPPLQLWENFWTMMGTRLREFRDSLPSLKEALGENLINSIYQIGDVFANALDSWVTRGESFFKALAAGFRSMISQIISELVRLMVMKAVLNIVGSFGGIFGGGGAAGGGISEGIGAGLGGGSAPMLGGMMPAFAGGASSSIVNNSTFSPTMNFTVHGASNPQQTLAMIKGEVVKVLRQHEVRTK